MEQVEICINDFKAARTERQTQKRIEENGTEGRVGSAGKPL